ncbi:Endonuclease/exonuclease/phosphatase [Lipomyces tetrasporus]
MHLNVKWEDSNEELEVRVYTHNVRFANQHPAKGEELWEKRKYPIAASIMFNTFNQNAIVVLQEVLHNQLLDLMKILGDEWTYCGVGRDDGKSKGEYAPIIFRCSQFKVELNRTFWLSDTPDIPSKGWDAATFRIVNVALLNHKSSGRVIYALNTHLDSQGSVARKMGAKVIKGIIDNLEDHDVLVLGGDMNSEPNHEAYPIFSSFLEDARKVVDKNLMYGNSSTFTGFTESERNRIIDYIFVYPGVKVLGYAVLDNKFEDGVYSSDHRPVVANIVIKKK